MSCRLKLCTQRTCHCGTVVLLRKCSTHDEYLRVEAVPSYKNKEVREGRKKRIVLTELIGWSYYLVCPIKGCGHSRAWKNGPRNAKTINH